LGVGVALANGVAYTHEFRIETVRMGGSGFGFAEVLSQFSSRFAELVRKVDELDCSEGRW
jgi:hypothetical protein